MKYPYDFKRFNGHSLTAQEIDNLIQEALRKMPCTLSTGDTLIEIDEDGNIDVWQLRAYREVV